MSHQIMGHSEVLLGDEAVALGAIHAGVTAAYAYPGTPSTEIVQYMIEYGARHGRPRASWCANEKTAFESALGVSFAGRRALVAMKHVGLNVAADPFINAALVDINGGLVVAVADDPGMHSSQNEQDTRYLADFAKVICLEPATQKEAYEMTREAFDLSERFHVPVVLRLVTHIAHSRAVVELSEPRDENTASKVPDPSSWILLPNNARRQFRALVDKQRDMLAYTESCPHNALTAGAARAELGVITTGVARNYYFENLADLERPPAHLHIGAYPMPVDAIRELAERVDRVLVLEEGYPYVERYLRGIIPLALEINGRMDDTVPAVGELTPSIVRSALGLECPEAVQMPKLRIPSRPPQLCAGCPHRDSYDAISKAVSPYERAIVTSDIGCYTLGALPPYSAIETCLCMGASIGIAKGAADAGFHPVLAVIGDSTFLHSGVTPLMDAVASNTDMTLIILDNETVAMTGTQPTILPHTRLKDILLGVGVEPEHVHVFYAHPKKVEEHADVIRREIEHEGLSVVVMVRECLESVRHRRQEERRAKS